MRRVHELISKYRFLDGLTWGIECGDGWYNILDGLFDRIQRWYEVNAPEDLADFLIVQVKEKYGSLRVYVSGTFPEVFDMIDAAESASQCICENCGNAGTMRNDHGWYLVSCDKCFTNRENYENL